MKKLVLLLALLLITSVSCNNPTEKDLSQSSYISDNSELEEAKAITRKLFEGLQKVEDKKISREAFEKQAEPLQKKLNALILSMGDRDAKELEDYKNKLMVKMIQKEKDPSNT